MSKKIHSKDQFELCFLRHQYLKRSNINPKKEELQPYSHIIHSQAGKTYATYKKLFYAVGFDFIDIVRIGEVHLVSFLALFSIDRDKKKFDRFTEAFCDKNLITPGPKDILDKNKANFTCFMKQRMEDLVRICHQKVRNIRGVPMKEFHIFVGSNLPTVRHEELVNNFHKLGFRKLDSQIFRAIKKKAKPENQACFKFNNLWYITVPTNYEPLKYIDFCNTPLDPKESIHTWNPEEVILLSESTKKWDKVYKKFKKIPRHEKINLIQSFIDTNKGNSQLEEELHTAEKILSRMDK